MGFGIFSRIVVIAGLVFGLTSCGGGGASSGILAAATASGAVLQYLVVTPGVPPTLSKGSTQQFVATGYYSDGTWQTLTPSVTWNSSTPTMASINAAGQAAGLAIGSTNITASAGGIASLPVTLHVMQAKLTSIAITSTNPPSIGVGQASQYAVTGTYSDGFMQDITPSVSWYGTTSVVDVNTMYTTTPGLAVGIAPGAATITANVNGFTASASLTVTNTYAVGGTLSQLPAGASITLSNTVGGTTDSVTLNANGSYYFPVALAAGSTYDVSVSTNIATPHPCTVVDGSGTISATTPTPVTSVQVVCGPAVGTLAGGSLLGNAVDGTGTAATFNFPEGVAVDAAGNVYVADTSNSLIRKITPAGVVTTLAGTAGTIGYADGPAATAKFWSPSGVAVDTAGNVYVADTNNNRIRKITPAGVVSTLAGSSTGASGFTNGTGSAASFYYPNDVALDTAGNLYVADWGNNAIRKITPSGVVSTVAGGGIGVTGSTNGAAAGATFNAPRGVAVDTASNVYVADTGNHLIRKIAAGQVTTLAGSTLSGVFGGFANGTGTASMFDSPMDVAVDGAGNVYVSDVNNYLIRFITPNGVVTTLAGTTKTSGFQDGPALSATFGALRGVAVDSAGNVYVSDGDLIRKVTP
jgi:sugar lactone lactonase YvrE